MGARKIIRRRSSTERPNPFPFLFCSIPGQRRECHRNSGSLEARQKSGKKKDSKYEFMSLPGSINIYEFLSALLRRCFLPWKATSANRVIVKIPISIEATSKDEEKKAAEAQEWLDILSDRFRSIPRRMSIIYATKFGTRQAIIECTT